VAKKVLRLKANKAEKTRKLAFDSKKNSEKSSKKEQKVLKPK
jgi:hypothetical protein